MALEFLLATRPSELDAAYRLRYQVFCREDGYDLGAAGLNFERYVDFWDTFESTHTFLLLSEGNVVGTARVVIENELGIPEDSQYDFVIADLRRSLPPGSAALLGRVAVASDFRGLGFGRLIVEMAVSFLRRAGVGYGLAIVNPVHSAWWESSGWRPSGEDFPCTGVDHPLRLVYVDLLNPSETVASQDLCLRAEALHGAHRWHFLRRGESFLGEEKLGLSLWEVLEGEALVYADGSEMRVGPGALLSREADPTALQVSKAAVASENLVAVAGEAA